MEMAIARDKSSVSVASPCSSQMPRGARPSSPLLPHQTLPRRTLLLIRRVGLKASLRRSLLSGIAELLAAFSAKGQCWRRACGRRLLLALRFWALGDVVRVRGTRPDFVLRTLGCLVHGMLGCLVHGMMSDMVEYDIGDVGYVASVGAVRTPALCCCRDGCG